MIRRYGRAGASGSRENGLSMRINLNEMSRRLGRTIPEGYRAFIESSPSSRYEGTLADPAEICALNLAARAMGPSGPTTYGFVLYGQDGDYFLLRDGDDSGSLHSWSHETQEIARAASDADALLHELSAIPIPDLEPQSLVLSRVERCTQSMLCPIDPHELQAAADGIPGVSVFEYTESVNPFTQEPIRFHTPGIEVAVEGGQPLILRLVDGCLSCNDLEGPVPDQVNVLANRLRARVLSSGS